MNAGFKLEGNVLWSDQGPQIQEVLTRGKKCNPLTFAIHKSDADVLFSNGCFQTEKLDMGNTHTLNGVVSLSHSDKFRSVVVFPIVPIIVLLYLILFTLLSTLFSEV